MQRLGDVRIGSCGATSGQPHRGKLLFQVDPKTAHSHSAPVSKRTRTLRSILTDVASVAVLTLLAIAALLIAIAAYFSLGRLIFGWIVG